MMSARFSATRWRPGTRREVRAFVPPPVDNRAVGGMPDGMVWSAAFPSRGHEMPRAQKAEQAPAKKATQSHGATAKHAAREPPKKEPAKKAPAKAVAKTTAKIAPTKTQPAKITKDVSKTPAKAAKTTTKAAPKAT